MKMFYRMKIHFLRDAICKRDTQEEEDDDDEGSENNPESIKKKKSPEYTFHRYTSNE